MTQTVWTLPIASQEIENGPEANISPGTLVIRFRGEDDNDWHRIEFSDVMKVVFTEFSACREEHLNSYDKLVDLGVASPFARELIINARRDMTGLRHFQVFFDDVGAYDVFARTVEVV